MDRIHFLRNIEESGNINPSDLILIYFDQIMYLYNLCPSDIKILSTEAFDINIVFTVQYPYPLEHTDTEALIKSMSGQNIRLYQNAFTMQADRISPDTEKITFTTISG